MAHFGMTVSGALTVMTLLCHIPTDEVLHQTQPLLIVKLRSAMDGSRDHYELYRQLRLFISGREFSGLLRRHLRVGVAVNQKQRRIVCINMKHRTRQPSEIGLLRRGPAKQELQSRQAHLHSRLSTLAEDARQIRSAVEAHD